MSVSDLMDDVLHSEDKRENRQMACFRSFEEDNIKICDTRTGKEVWHIDATIGRANLGDYNTQFCLEEFTKLGFINCRHLPKPEDTMRNQAIKNIPVAASNIGILPSPYPNPIDIDDEDFFLVSEKDTIVNAMLTFDSNKCLKLFEREDISICDTNNRVIVPKENLDDCANDTGCIAISSWEIKTSFVNFNDDYLEICIREFNQKGFIDCDTNAFSGKMLPEHIDDF